MKKLKIFKKQSINFNLVVYFLFLSILFSLINPLPLLLRVAAVFPYFEYFVSNVHKFQNLVNCCSDRLSWHFVVELITWIFSPLIVLTGLLDKEELRSRSGYGPKETRWALLLLVFVCVLLILFFFNFGWPGLQFYLTEFMVFGVFSYAYILLLPFIFYYFGFFLRNCLKLFFKGV